MTMTVLKERDRLGVRPGQLFIDGTWADATDGATFDQVNPATNEVVTTFALGTAADVDRAVRAARGGLRRGPLAPVARQGSQGDPAAPGRAHHPQR